MVWLRWAFHIAVQLVPVLLSIDWNRPKSNTYYIPKYPKPHRRQRKSYSFLFNKRRK